MGMYTCGGGIQRFLQESDAEVEPPLLLPFGGKELFQLDAEGVPAHGLEVVLLGPVLVALVQLLPLHLQLFGDDAAFLDELAQRILFLPILPAGLEDRRWNSE